MYRTVAQLIECLSEMDQSLPVFIAANPDGEYQVAGSHFQIYEINKDEPAVGLPTGNNAPDNWVILRT